MADSGLIIINVFSWASGAAVKEAYAWLDKIDIVTLSCPGETDNHTATFY